MKDDAPPALQNAALKDALLETIVSAHYLALQMRTLSGSAKFLGAAETELMAEALSRWARLAGDRWSAAAGDAPSVAPWSGGRRDGDQAARDAGAAMTSENEKLGSAGR